MLDKISGKGLLIHHWDTDGICSARLLLEYLKEEKIENTTPILGNYYLTEEELNKYSKYDFVIISDMALPVDNIKYLSKSAKIFIFDHHLQQKIDFVDHHNPVISGKNPDLYPSASWIVNDYLKNDVNLFSILGIIGDHEQKIKKNQYFFDIISKFCKKNKLTFNDLLQMVYLLDSSYKIGDRDEIISAPWYLLKIKSGQEILNNSKWNNNLEKLNSEIQKQLDIKSEIDADIIIKRINTKYNIISTVTRKIFWDSKKDTIVVNPGFFKDSDQIYVRSGKDMQEIIMKGKSYGFKAGGKKEVMGAIVPKDKTELFIKEILDFLKS